MRLATFTIISAALLLPLEALASEPNDYTYSMDTFKKYNSEDLPYCRYRLTVNGENWGWFDAVVTRKGYEWKPRGYMRGSGTYTCTTQDHGDYKFSNYKFMWGKSCAPCEN